MAKAWFLPALAALIFYGFWAFFPKMAVRYIAPSSAVFWEVVGAGFVGIVMFLVLRARPETAAAGVAYAISTGVVGMLGTLCFFIAARTGPLSIVVSVTALYPLVTLLLAFLVLGESLNPRQILGVAMAIGAILLLSSS